VPKLPVQYAEITTQGLIDDYQLHQHVHGGPQRAICLYSLERILSLQDEGHPVYPGAIGENLTITGLDWIEMRPGVQIRIGVGVLLEVTKFTVPCDALTNYFIDGNINRISNDIHPGWARVYARVLEAGKIVVGDIVDKL
jgi:MOSC domain-containing protein YiiM